MSTVLRTNLNMSQKLQQLGFRFRHSVGFKKSVAVLVTLNLAMFFLPALVYQDQVSPEQAKAATASFNQQQTDYLANFQQQIDLTTEKISVLGTQAEQPVQVIVKESIPEPTVKPKTNAKIAASPVPTPTPTKIFNIQPFPTPGTGNCPVTTMRCVPCNAGEPACRSVQGAATGFKGWSCQNNNPGNIRYSLSRINLITLYGGSAPCGSKGPSSDSQYMVFSDYLSGRNALKAYLKSINAGANSAYLPECAAGACSLRQFFSKYAPAADQNDPASYSNFVANFIGVDADNTPLSWIVQNKLELMTDAIQTHEGWFVQ
jgi:hypothetical protein